MIISRNMPRMIRKEVEDAVYGTRPAASLTGKKLPSFRRTNLKRDERE